MVAHGDGGSDQIRATSIAPHAWVSLFSLQFKIFGGWTAFSVLFC